MNVIILGVTVFSCVVAMCLAWSLDREAQRRHEWHMQFLGLPYPGDEGPAEDVELATGNDPKDPQQS